MSDDYFKKCEPASQVEIKQIEARIFRAADDNLSFLSHVFNILGQRQRLSKEYLHMRHNMDDQTKANVEYMFQAYNDDLKNLLSI